MTWVVRRYLHTLHVVVSQTSQHDFAISYTWSFPGVLTDVWGAFLHHTLEDVGTCICTKLNCLFWAYLPKIDDCMTLSVKLWYLWYAEVAQSASKPEDVWQHGEDPFDGVSGSRQCDGRGGGRKRWGVTMVDSSRMTPEPKHWGSECIYCIWYVHNCHVCLYIYISTDKNKL